MKFQTLYNPDIYPGEINDGTLLVVPNEALSPKQILQRFVRDMPVPQTSVAPDFVNDNLDNEAFPMQGQEYDPMEERDKLIAQKEQSKLV